MRPINVGGATGASLVDRTQCGEAAQQQRPNGVPSEAARSPRAPRRIAGWGGAPICGQRHGPFRIHIIAAANPPDRCRRNRDYNAMSGKTTPCDYAIPSCRRCETLAAPADNELRDRSRWHIWLVGKLVSSASPVLSASCRQASSQTSACPTMSSPRRSGIINVGQGPSRRSADRARARALRFFHADMRQADGGAVQMEKHARHARPSPPCDRIRRRREDGRDRARSRTFERGTSGERRRWMPGSIRMLNLGPRHQRAG